MTVTIYLVFLILKSKTMNPRIEHFSEKKFIGVSAAISLTDNKTMLLWRSFMPKRKEIRNPIGTELYSIQCYDVLYFKNFNPSSIFEKWAAIEVTDFEIIPETMNSLIIPSGLYAVFLYKGSSSDNGVFNYIFTDWLPNSEYILDNRPHFEVLGEKYKNDDQDSEEEIWIPITPKVS